MEQYIYAVRILLTLKLSRITLVLRPRSCQQVVAFDRLRQGAWTFEGSHGIYFF